MICIIFFTLVYAIAYFSRAKTSDLAMLMRCSNQLSYQATNVGSRSIVGSCRPVKEMHKFRSQFISFPQFMCDLFLIYHSYSRNATNPPLKLHFKMSPIEMKVKHNMYWSKAPVLGNLCVYYSTFRSPFCAVVESSHQPQPSPGNIETFLVF